MFYFCFSKDTKVLLLSISKYVRNTPENFRLPSNSHRNEMNLNLEYNL
nr:MAG TPA: hypothetical protein [Caudoviricetes sp.]